MGKFTCILLSERSQTPKAPYSDSFHMTLWKTYEYREEKRSVAARGCWMQGGGVYTEVAQRNFGAMELFSVELWGWTHDCTHLSKTTELCTLR